MKLNYVVEIREDDSTGSYIEYRGYESLGIAFKYVWFQMHLLLHDVEDTINDYYSDYKYNDFYVDSDKDEKTVLWMIYPIEKLSKQEYLGNRYEVMGECCPDGFFDDTDFNWEKWNKSVQEEYEEFEKWNNFTLDEDECCEEEPFRYFIFDRDDLDEDHPVFYSREEAEEYLSKNSDVNLVIEEVPFDDDEDFVSVLDIEEPWDYETTFPDGM